MLSSTIIIASAAVRTVLCERMFVQLILMLSNLSRVSVMPVPQLLCRLPLITKLCEHRAQVNQSSPTLPVHCPGQSRLFLCALFLAPSMQTPENQTCWGLMLRFITIGSTSRQH
jgi:hypothetical protein